MRGLFPTIEALYTPSFDLLPTVQSDLEPLFTVASDPMVWEQHPANDRWRRDVFERFFADAMSNPLGCFTVIERASSKVIGSTRFYGLQENPSAVRIGYTFLSRDFWGTAANAEIKAAMLALAFNHVDTVYFDVGVNNHRSRRAVEKLGAESSPSANKDTVVYALTSASYTLAPER